MSVVLLDTSVASLLVPQPQERLLLRRYEPDLRGQVLAVGLQTVADLWQGAEEAAWGERKRTVLDAFIARMLVLSPDEETARLWGRFMAHARRIGRRLEAGDGWIAATAIRWRLPLVTHDRDFVGLSFEGLTVICRAP
jgi:tRNA(fMet)-specific endonuclease VapC